MRYRKDEIGKMSEEEIKEMILKLEEALIEHRSKWASYYLGILKSRDLRDVEAQKEAIRYFQIASIFSPLAKVKLGNYYEEGIFIEPNIKLAIKYYKEGMKAKVAEAFTSMGLLYQEGYGVKQSNKKAYKLHKKGASLGCELSKLNVKVLKYLKEKKRNDS